MLDSPDRAELINEVKGLSDKEAETLHIFVTGRAPCQRLRAQPRRKTSAQGDSAELFWQYADRFAYKAMSGPKGPLISNNKRVGIDIS